MDYPHPKYILRIVIGFSSAAAKFDYDDLDILATSVK